ncbi:MAG: hypothetical protein JO265_00960 [Acidimicrobiia bacterium]|nr:hypothetical protein [Acidimicrobiia bacterium]
MTTAIEFEASLPWPLHEVSRALRDLAWTFPRPPGVHPMAGRIEVDLQIPLGASSSMMHRALVELGPAERGQDLCRLPVTISASRQFPTFRGAFEAREELGDTDLVLVGECRLPLGVAGRASGGSGLARASLRRFFETAVKAMRADLQATAPAWRPAAPPDSLRDA